MLVPTPHNAAKFGDIANVVLMPGDPLRAKYIAEKYLDDAVCYNTVRSMFGYTGTYKGVKISVQGSGMGVPSMGIYSKELYEGYNVNTIIRIGSAGALVDNIKLRDIVVASVIDTDSNYFNVNIIDKESKPIATEELINKLCDISNEKNIDIKVGKVYTSDTFYDKRENLERYANDGSLVAEMETLALYTNAINAKKNAIAMFTVSDRLLLGESLSAEQRESSFDEMLLLALELAINCK